MISDNQNDNSYHKNMAHYKETIVVNSYDMW